MEPLRKLGLDSEIISNSTSSGLTKLLSTKKAVYLANPEISEYLLKLFKNDDENCSGDTQLLCKLFSGEPCTSNYATENQRTLDENLAFCIIGKHNYF